MHTPISVRAARTASLVAFMAVFLASCAGSSVEAFPWEDASGKKLAFFLRGGAVEPGAEAALPGDASTRQFRLAKAILLRPGEDLVLEMDVHVPDCAIRIDLAAGSGKSQKSVRYEFLLEPGSVALHLEPPGSAAETDPGASSAGAKIQSVAMSVSSPAAPSKDKSASGAAGLEPCVTITRIAVSPAFRGFRRPGTPALELSSCYSGGNEGETYKADILIPFWGLETPGSSVSALVIAYSGRSSSDIVVSSPEGTKILVQAANPKGLVILPADLFGGQPSSVAVKFPRAVMPTALYATTISSSEAEIADLGRIVMAPSPVSDVDFSLYRWDVLPDVLVFDFRDYATQDAYLKRLAFFVEKEGYRGRLASDGEIGALHGWNAHDYRPEDLAAFFTVSKKQSFPLNASEKRLESLLLERGVIAEDGDGYKAGAGAIISITRESADYLRRTFATHESIHALFFADSEYRDYAASVWASMGGEERWFWTLYFGWMRYDVSSPYLMANEVQAYLMQQPPSRAREYFSEVLPARLLENHPELKAPIDAYMAEYGDRFEQRAKALDSWVRARYGFGAGRTFFVRNVTR